MLTSMGSVAGTLDIGIAESSFASMQTEQLHRHRT
jgi:hypothetical protein